MDNNNMMNENSNGSYDPNGQYDPNMQYNPNGQGDPNMQYGSGGQNYYYQQPQQPYQPDDIYAKPGEGGTSDGWAIASLVCGILAIMTCCCYGIGGVVLGIAAIVFACISKSQNGGRMPSLSIAGLICGIIGLVFGLCYFGVLILGIIGSAADI